MKVQKNKKISKLTEQVSNVFEDKLIQSIKAKALTFLNPPPDLTVSDWANQNRIIKFGSRQGPFDVAYTPYLKRVLDAFTDPEVKMITLMYSAQLGKSLSIENMIGYLMEYAPCPILYVLPDETFIKTFADTKLKSLIEDTPSLEKIVSKRSPGKSGSNIHLISFPGGHLKLASANSVSALAGTTMKIVFADEVDKYPRDLKGQGGSLEQAIRRAQAYTDRKVVLSSTPTFKGASKIEEYYLQGTMEQFHVPCIHCNTLFHMETKLLKWDKQTVDGKTIHLTSTAAMACPNCGGLHTDADKISILKHGEWISTNTNADKSHISQQANIYLSPFVPFKEVADEFIKMSKTESGLKAFTQLFEGLPFEPRSDYAEWTDLKNRTENYKMLTIPAGVAFLTAGVDVQGNRVAVSIYGWGRGEEAWLIFHTELHAADGEVNDSNVWDRLAELLDTNIYTSNGIAMKPISVAVDSSDGHTQLAVYDFVRPRSKRFYFPIKGSTNMNAPAISPGKKQEFDARGKPLKGAVELFHLGVSLIKQTLYSRLSNKQPGTHGYVHYYDTLDDEYFMQLTAEKLVNSYDKNGYPTLVWQKQRKRNEAIDCFVYAYAAALRININSFTSDAWDRLYERAGLVNYKSAPAQIESVTDTEQCEVAPCDTTNIVKPPQQIVNEPIITQRKKIKVINNASDYIHKRR